MMMRMMRTALHLAIPMIERQWREPIVHLVKVIMEIATMIHLLIHLILVECYQPIFVLLHIKILYIANVGNNSVMLTVTLVTIYVEQVLIKVKGCMTDSIYSVLICLWYSVIKYHVSFIFANVSPFLPLWQLLSQFCDNCSAVVTIVLFGDYPHCDGVHSAISALFS